MAQENLTDMSDWRAMGRGIAGRPGDLRRKMRLKIDLAVAAAKRPLKAMLEVGRALVRWWVDGWFENPFSGVNRVPRRRLGLCGGFCTRHLAVARNVPVVLVIAIDHNAL